MIGVCKRSEPLIQAFFSAIPGSSLGALGSLLMQRSIFPPSPGYLLWLIRVVFIHRMLCDKRNLILNRFVAQGRLVS